MKRSYINIYILTIALVIFLMSPVSASKFDELDKPPTGAHKGQMFLGAFFAIGGVFGEIIDAEHDFVKNSTYEFTENDTIKKLWVDHLSFSVGIGFEYMYMDHMGVKAKLKKSFIVQRTVFGAEFKNWTETFYDDYDIVVGPTFHITNRKQWDFTFTPVIGLSIGELSVTPIANKLIDGYSGNRNKSIVNFTCGGEFNLSIYFSGGLYLSLGFDYTMNLLDLDSPYNLTNPQSGAVFFQGQDSTYLHTLCFILSVGYAFSN